MASTNPNPTQSVPATQRPTTVSPPFDKPTADVVLRTSDHVNFHVHKTVLALASSFFDGMFTLPQPKGQDHNDVYVINITEDSRTLDYLLWFCYPVKDPRLDTVGGIHPVLAAAIKYQMDEATVLMKKVLLQCTSTHPLQVYAVASSLSLDYQCGEHIEFLHAGSRGEQ
ncbi:hypothetical protein B0H21DRAFT_823664 [Amylocystis lapponica]|nr:hypothetical protein B0H21DRAFT_823664 [Amylocystis lapponica]